MIEERIDELIKVYKGEIDKNRQIIEKRRNTLIEMLNDGLDYNIQLIAKSIEQKREENEIFKTFIQLLEYANTGKIE